MILRAALRARVLAALGRSPVAAILGPRQCGKTTLAREVAEGRKCETFDLEDQADRDRLANPRLALEGASGLVVIDEVQRRPELFEVLRVLVDRPGRRARFLLLGSASPDLVRGVSESLAGRIAFVDMGGFDLGEVGAERHRKLWIRGAFPRSFLATSEERSLAWREEFVRTFLERDLSQLGIGVSAEALGRFWNMVAHFHGGIWNAADFARSLGTSEPTARRYLDVLTGTFLVRQLRPWHENIGKRQVKAPKVYLRDSGLLHALLGLKTIRDLTRHPKLGASWEGFALEQVLSAAGPADAWFWGTHAGAELDLLLMKRGRRWGFEMKCADVPQVTRSMRIAMQDLRLDRLWVVHPGAKSYPLDRGIEALGISDLAAGLPRI